MNFIIVGIIIVVALVGATSRFLFKKTDNIVEQVAEKIIKDKTGIVIDLSPDTPEVEDSEVIDIASEKTIKGIEKLDTLIEKRIVSPEVKEVSDGNNK